MNKLIDGTQYRETPAGIIAIRGKREIYFLGTSVDQTDRARKILATNSFNKIFNAGKRAPMKNAAVIRL